jgi:hypothetical protein
MVNLGIVVLATEMLLNARWILHEELGILGRTEADAKSDRLEALHVALNRSSDRLAEIASAAGLGVAASEALGDRAASEVTQRARALLQADGTAGAETFFLRACVLALRELHAAGVLANDNDVTRVPAELLPLLESRLEELHGFGAESSGRIRESAEDLLRVWQSWLHE